MAAFRIIPAVIVPWAVYHILVWTADPALPPAQILDSPLFHINLPNGGRWAARTGDAVILLTVLAGFYEVLKSSIFTRAQIWDHALSALLFIGAAVEFLTLGFAQTSEFFFILVALFCDLVVGYAVSVRVARRDVTVGAFGTG